MWAGTILIVLALSFGIGEAAARLAHVHPFHVQESQYIGWARRDPVLGWRNNPGVHRVHEGTHEPMTILADGSRATGAPPGDGTTVVVVGCSNVEGYGIRDDETLAWQLQRRFPNLRVRNFATPGYGTYQSLMLLRELTDRHDFHPAIVIYGFLPHHAQRNVLTYQMLDAFRAFGGQRFSPPHVELHAGLLQAFPPFVVANWPLEEHSALVTLLHESELRVRLAGRERDEEEVTRILLVEMKQLVERLNGRFLVITLWDAAPPGLESYRRMSAAMRNSGIEELDLTYRGPETRREKLMVGGNGHPTGIVHAWWADQLTPWLEQHLAKQ